MNRLVWKHCGHFKSQHCSKTVTARNFDDDDDDDDYLLSLSGTTSIGT